MATGPAQGPGSGSARSEVEMLVGPAASTAERVGRQAADDARVEAALLDEHLPSMIGAALAGRRLSRADLAVSGWMRGASGP